MSQLKRNSLFCEDFRVENSGQPMLIGILSRIVEIPKPQNRLNSLYFVSLFYPREEHLDTRLRLTILIYNADRDETVKKGPFERALGEGVTLEDDEDLVMISLPVTSAPIEVGTTVTAILEIDDEVEEYKIKVESVED